MKKLSLSSIIPTYNDETTIAAVIAKAAAIGQHYCDQYEIVVLNDASTDQTPAILTSLTKKEKSLRVLNHKTNKGYGLTIKELYYAAQCEWLFSIPGDFQIDPEEVVKLLPATSTADMILGLRQRRHDA